MMDFKEYVYFYFAEFKRKVYSVLYLDLDKKMPRSINVVETYVTEL